MKISLTVITMISIVSLIFAIGCKSKKDINDPTQLEVHVLVELEEGVSAKRVKEEIKQFDFSDFKQSNKTLNQHVYKVILKGQTSDELLRALNSKEYVKSAIIAPSGDGPAQNMPPGKSSRTSPIKG